MAKLAQLLAVSMALSAAPVICIVYILPPAVAEGQAMPSPQPTGPLAASTL